MARSPLMQLLSRQIALMQHATRHVRQSGEPLSAAMERLSAARLPRRDVLKAGAALAAVPVISACGPTEMSTKTPPTIAIVGAGMAGLHCAYRLFKDSGLRATVYEAQKRLGGRMFTDRETFKSMGGMHAELGGELIDTPQVTMLRLAKELELPLLDYRNDRHVDPLTTWFSGARKGTADLIDEWAPIAEKITADLDAITSDDFPTYKNAAGGAALDAMNLKQYLDSLVDPTSYWGQLLGTAYVTEYGLELEQQSALNFLFLTGTEAEKIELFGVSDERFHTASGNDSFISKLAAALPDDTVKTEHVLKKVTRGSDGRYVATFDAPSGAVEVKADHLVLSIPFTMLRTVDLSGLALPEVKKKAIAELGYGTNAKLMLGFDSRPWRTPAGTAIASNGESFTDLGYQCSWETSRLQAPDSAAGIITNFTGGARGVAAGQGTPAERAAEFLTQFDTVFPGSKMAHNSKVARFHWPSNAWVKGSYQCYLPGQYTGIRGAEGERVENLHFCGEHTSLSDGGYMEGAAATGAEVAAAIAAS